MNNAIHLPGATDTSFVFSGLQVDGSSQFKTVTNGTSYDLRIRSYTQQPNTDGSEEEHFRTSSWVTVADKTPAGEPEAPGGLTVTAGVERLGVSWTAPSSGGSDITGYDLHFKTWDAPDSAGTGSDPTTGWVAATHAGTSTTADVTGLTDGAAYYTVRVRASNALGSGPWSLSEPLWSAQLTAGSALGSRSGVGCNDLSGSTHRCSTESNLTDDEFSLPTTPVTSGSVSAIIDAPSGLIFQTDQPLSSSDLTFCVGTTAYALADSSVAPGFIHANLWATVDVGWSAGDQVVLRLQRSSSCSGVTVRSSDNTLSALTASSSTGAGGTFSSLDIGSFSSTTTSYTATVANAITHVKLTPTANHAAASIGVRKGATGSFTPVTSGSTTAAIALDVGANPITLRVTAEDTTTQEYTVTVTRSVLAVGPAPPTGLSLTAGDAQLAASWTAPTGVTVQRYEAQIKLKSAQNWPTGDTDVSGTSHTFTGLTNGSPYQVRVRTVEISEGGNAGAWSTPAEGTPQAPAAAPSVSLSASPLTVPEGSPVTVTATLSAALTSAVTIPLTLTRNSSEPGDHGTLTSISISANATTGTGQITTAQDTDTADETFTVALGNLPASVTAGSPASIVITIQDDDAPPVDPPVDPPPDGGPAGSAPYELPPGPLKLALWTDRSSYRPGQQLRLFRSLDPRRLPDEHAVLLYLQRVGSEQRTYLALHANGDQLRSEPVDHFGRPQGAFLFHVPDTVDRQQTWQGPAPLQPGLWQFVMELHSRSESSEPKRIWAKFMVGPGRVLNRRGFQREVTQELTLTGDRVHYLLHRLVVRPGATLRLQAGALLRAHGPSAEIVVEPGGRIVAEGTRQAPVVLTCSAPVGQRAPGCWGGLRIHGRAPITAGEGAAADDDAWYDSSGSLRYLRVEFAGGSPQQDTAAPALALHGVGFGTLMHHVQVRSSAGDGIAFLGGAVRCDYCLASDSGGRGLSWQRGFRGSLRHLYVWQGSGDGDAVHGRNLDSGPDRQPRSHPVLANVTLTVTAPWRAGKGAGLRLQAGSALTATRLLVLGFSRSAALVADPRAAQLFEDGTSAVTDSIQFRNLRAHRGWNGAGVKFRTHAALTLRNADTDPNHDPRPKRLQEVLLDSHGEAAYIGAFGEENWLEEWTVFGPESEYDLRERSEDEN